MTGGDRFTVIGWASGPYKRLFDGLRSDCERFGYPVHLYELDEEYTSLVKAWCNHPRIIRRGVEDFGTVLFLDIECRIVAPIPDHWRAPLVSVRWPPQKFWIRYNSGTVMADESCLPWIDAWCRTIEEWDMAHLDHEDHVHYPGDLCDELGLAAAIAALGVRVNTPHLEYIDRSTDAEIVRGLWRNEHTVVQHPTIHHWPKEPDPVECKKLFVQNFPGDPSAAERLFRAPAGPVERDGWVFETGRGVYAPAEYWELAPRPWVEGPVSLTSAQR
ncbi:MAG TPA: hypothetical protein VGH73_10230 [Thermoanaerobaculia bacterium]|jgi:hypothetical protein